MIKDVYFLILYLYFKVECILVFYNEVESKDFVDTK